IPFGVFHLPKDQYGEIYTGSLGNIYPKYVVEYLETARRNGTKVMLSLPSGESNFKNSNKSFSMSKWKDQVNRFRGVDFSSYIEDGTVIGHYILDEPHDPENWGGRLISPATIDEMARYSKQLWPTMPTIVRSWPKYLKGYDYKYLDAAWAQYSERHGTVKEFIEENVRLARESGLALVVGMNQLAGGSSKGLRGYYSGRYSMSASELESWGSVLLDNSYPCAFLSWQYNAKYMGRSDIKAAMTRLAGKARSHATKSCRGARAGEPEDSEDSEEPEDSEPPADIPEPPANQPEPPVVQPEPSSSIRLSVAGESDRKRHFMKLTWSGAAGSKVDVYRNGVLRKTTENDGKYTNVRSHVGAATYAYKVCERGSSRCSDEVQLTVR
ncbi:MAG TPA: hypothetical protein VF252_03415, partial [Gemmatimonadales bacterium]